MEIVCKHGVHAYEAFVFSLYNHSTGVVGTIT